MTAARTFVERGFDATSVHDIAATLGMTKAGLDHDIDPATGAFAVLGMIIWLPQWVRPGGRLTVDQVVEQVATIALQGLLKPGFATNARKSTKATKTTR
jgi:hypothetical protein